MAPDAFMEKLQEILEHWTRAGLQRPLFFVCIAADGCTMTGSSTTDSRVVVTHPAQEELPLPINVLFVDATANAQHVAISRPDDG
jgi:hypothetical protein